MHVPCSDPIPPILSPTPPDPSLTPDNILQATHNIPLWKSDDSYRWLDMPHSQHKEISRMYDGEKAKYELVSAWLAGHPCPSWSHVKNLLSWLESRGRGRKGAEDEVDKKYLTSELQYNVQFSLNSLQTCVIRIYMYTCTCTCNVCVQCVFRSSVNDLYTVYVHTCTCTCIHVCIQLNLTNCILLLITLPISAWDSTHPAELSWWLSW